ncbi:exonuclease domain-containing protein [Enemella evansiae]|uniref:exonuclease domain-containing protein n=1 Tax=Enemella evansiae TaxID=2016499 RepID=UPI00105C6826|nr:exonuclease domain-containing protein [Enemella evansiae]TDO86065.1 DNA polymerase-3 subunit epsilon [Enemella evansiae]
MTGYTVIDVETTGLVPERHDRIVEFAVTYVSHEGQIQDRWSTLIDPGRDVGPTRIHGITASDVVGAPTFAELAPYVMRSIAGRVLVAHNASFDLRFLAAELGRVGISLSQLPIAGVCTMRWAPSFVTSPGRGLSDCCSAIGIPNQRAHSAGGDAVATAGLLSYYLDRCEFEPPWRPELSSARAYPWPTDWGMWSEFRLQPRGSVSQHRPDEWLARIISLMPRAASPQVDAYLAVLEMAMLDGFLSESEKDDLVHTATSLRLNRGQVLDVHAGYLLTMARVAWHDGVVTDDEHAELVQATRMLGLSPADLDTALADAERSHHDAGMTDALMQMVGLTLNPGDRIAFTGEMKRERSEWEALARRAGLVPGGVARATRLVVAADPNSLSGKAAKARAYGIPVITEDAFAKILGSLGG